MVHSAGVSVCSSPNKTSVLSSTAAIWSWKNCVAPVLPRSDSCIHERPWIDVKWLSTTESVKLLWSLETALFGKQGSASQHFTYYRLYIIWQYESKFSSWNHAKGLVGGTTETVINGDYHVQHMLVICLQLQEMMKILGEEFGLNFSCVFDAVCSSDAACNDVRIQVALSRDRYSKYIVLD